MQEQCGVAIIAYPGKARLGESLVESLLGKSAKQKNSKNKAPRGGRTRNLEIKSLTLYRLS
jgi:hypothetical protein